MLMAPVLLLISMAYNCMINLSLSHTLRLCLCTNGSVLMCQIIIGHYTSVYMYLCDRYINTFKETYVYVHACTCSYLSIIYYIHTTCTSISTAYSVCTYCHLDYLLFILFIIYIIYYLFYLYKYMYIYPIHVHI